MKKQRIIPKHSHQAGGIIDSIFNTIGSNSDLIGKLFNWKDYTGSDIEKLKKAYENQYDLIGQQTFTGGFDELEGNYGNLNVASAPSKWDMGYMTKQQEQNAVLGATLSGFGRGYNVGKSTSKSINNFGKGLNEKYPGAADYLSENGFSDNSWGSSVEGMAGDFLNNYGGYATAAKIGTTWLGGVLGNIWGQNYVKDRNKAAEKAAAELENEREGALMRRHNNFRAAVSNADTQMDNFYQSQYAAFGGLLETNGADWKTGASFIDNGGTHQENPFGGVQFGIASDGMPNLVEEGEVVIKVRNNPNQGHSFADGGSPTYDDYVVSNREFPTLEEIANANITKTPEKYEGMSWADIYKDIFDKSHIKEVINRQDSKDYIDVLNERVAQAHEITRLRNQQEAIMNRLKKATPEEQDLILQQAGYPNLIEEAAYAAHGGEIYINPSKKGTFTAAAKKRGMGVQEFASKVLSNKEDYSPSMVKKANFARNASHWHQAGGYIPYDNSKGFEFFVDNDYTQNYKDWLNSRDWTGSDKPVFDRLSAIYKQYTGKTLTPQKATLLGKDKMFGPFHQAYGDEYRKYIEASKKPSFTPITIDIPEDDTSRREIYIPRVESDNLFGNPYREPAPELILPVENDAIPYDVTYPAETTVVETEDENNGKGVESVYNSSNTDWILPAVSSANLIADLAGLTNVADYSNADRIGRAILPPRYIGYNPNGRYVKPQLVDTNYLANRLANQSMAGINAAKDLSGSNRATALANIVAQNYLGQQAIGESIAKGQIENNKAIQDAVQINNAVDRANSEGFLQAARANQAAWDNYIGRYAAQKTAEAKLREDIDTQVAANRSANWNNFLENLQGYFDNQRNRNMANSAYQGTGYWIDNGGTIHYTAKNPSSKTMKEAERRAKEIKNKKGE